MLRVPGEKGREEWSQLHGKLAEIVAGASGDDPTIALQALLKVARDASSSQALKRALEETISKDNMVYFVSLVAHELQLLKYPVHMVDKDRNFCEANVDSIIKWSPELTTPNAPYAVVSIVRAQSSGKSYLLNRLFGTRFPEMDAKLKWTQTTRGIMISRCIGPSLLLLDVAGFDGREQSQDTSFENQAALFALMVSDLMIVNMLITDICRAQGSGKALFGTIFKTPLTTLKSDVLESMHEIWKSVNKESMLKFNDYIKVDIFVMWEISSLEFPKEVTELRQLLSENRSAKVPISCFTDSSKWLWDTIKKNENLNIPSHQVFIAGLYCRRVAEKTLGSLNSLEEYTLLKGEQSPSCFIKLSSALLERVETGYDLETEMYDPDVRGKERGSMIKKLRKIIADYARKLILKMRENTLAQFKGELDRNIQNKKPDDAKSSGEQSVQECLDKFMRLCQDLNLIDSVNLESICEQLKDQMRSHTTCRILEIEVENERKAREKAEKNGAIATMLGAASWGANLGIKIGSWLAQ